MLVALGTSIARYASHAILAGTLARGLITGFAGRTNRMAVAGCGVEQTRRVWKKQHKVTKPKHKYHITL